MNWVDCHLHLQDARLAPHRRQVLERARQAGVATMVVNGTRPADWDDVMALAETEPEVRPSLGVHPWYVKEAGEGWLETLEQWLVRHDQLAIGEVGLDKWVKNHDLALQEEMLTAQLELAVRYRRPVTIHGLQAWGRLLACLQTFPALPPFLLHSYSGPVEMVKPLVEMGAYFSLSGYFFRTGKENKLETFRQVPAERLLVETDAPDMLPPPEGRWNGAGHADETEVWNEPANLPLIYRAVARWRGMGPGELQEEIRANFERWFHFPARLSGESRD